VGARSAIVIGAGPAGLAAAIALRRAGIEPIVCERRPALEEAGSGVTLWPNALRALDRIGLGDAVRSAGAPADGIELRSWRGDVLSATSGALLRQRYGDVGVVLHRARLQGILADAVGAGHIRLGAALVGVERSGGRPLARFADGGALAADLLVGADGMRSQVRSALFGDVPLRDAGYVVWRAVTAFGTDQRAGSLSLGRGGQFGRFPMPGGRVYWFASLDAGRDCSDHDRLLASFAGWHEPVEALIAATDPAAIVRTEIQDARPLRRRASGSVVLAGDAAHPSTPALGQGACQAIEDAVVLGAVVRRRGDLGAALRDYERLRVRRTNAMSRRARRMGRMGQWRSRAACRLRDAFISGMPDALTVRDLDWQFRFAEPGDP
jgi:2-polyprenyl-6-methoxyphenol hydroxylase-like FAD-dependent oxidoreductase